MSDDKMNLRIGRNIEKLLIERGWEQKDLANKTGIHRVHISNIINGKKGISAAYTVKIAEAFNVTVAELTAPDGKIHSPQNPLELPSTPLSESRVPIFDRMLELVAENATLKERLIHMQAEIDELKSKLQKS